jgi:hypothetical protein
MKREPGSAPEAKSAAAVSETGKQNPPDTAPRSGKQEYAVTVQKPPVKYVLLVRHSAFGRAFARQIVAF